MFALVVNWAAELDIVCPPLEPALTRMPSLLAPDFL